MTENREFKGLSGAAIKIIAMVSMFIDHLGVIIVLPLMLTDTTGKLYMVYEVMRDLGRIAMPIFGFLAVEGVIHTRSKLKYLRNLFVFALISEIPFDMGFMGGSLEFTYQNVFFSLALGVIAASVMDELKKDNLLVKNELLMKVIGYAGLLFTMPTLVVLALNTDYAYSHTEIFTDKNVTIAYGVCALLGLLIFLPMTKGNDSFRYKIGLSGIVIYICALLADNVFRCDYGSFMVCLVVLVYIMKLVGRSNMESMLSGVVLLAIMSTSEIYAIADVILMELYNGERGRQMKYVLYAFYPVHILLLYLVAKAMGLA